MRMSWNICFAASLIFASVLAYSEDAKAAFLRIALVNTNVSSRDVAAALSEDCHDMRLTRNPSKADYFVEIQIEGNRVDLTLFDAEDDAVYWSETIKTHNAVKDMCQFIGQKGKKK